MNVMNSKGCYSNRWLWWVRIAKRTKLISKAVLTVSLRRAIHMRKKIPWAATSAPTLVQMMVIWLLKFLRTWAWVAGQRTPRRSSKVFWQTGQARTTKTASTLICRIIPSYLKCRIHWTKISTMKAAMMLTQMARTVMEVVLNKVVRKEIARAPVWVSTRSILICQRSSVRSSNYKILGSKTCKLKSIR